MQTQPGFENRLHFISSKARHIPASPSHDRSPRLAITISRQTGSGAHCVAASLANYLQARKPQDSCAWDVYDRDLVEKVLKDHNLPARLARFMPEDRTSELSGTLDELFGVHPPMETLVRQTAETVLGLARRGNVILIGRGAHIITSKLDYVFHVRLVGSLERRIQHVRETLGIGEKEALTLIRREDKGRDRYLKKYFGRHIEDPLAYHLIVNTDSGPYERAARLIADAALDHFHARQNESEKLSVTR